MKRLKISHKGFTLIELLIVLVIISIAGGIAMLTISHNQNNHYKDLAKQLSNMLILAEEEAMLRPAILGLAFTKNSFQFYEYKEQIKDKNNDWMPLDNKVLGLHKIPDDTEIMLSIHDKVIPAVQNTQKIIPQLIISTSGDIIPFTILIGKPNHKPSYQVIGNLNGNISYGPITS